MSPANDFAMRWSKRFAISLIAIGACLCESSCSQVTMPGSAAVSGNGGARTERGGTNAASTMGGGVGGEAGQPAGSGGAPAAGSSGAGAQAGVMCMRPLTNSGCPAGYAEAASPGKCKDSPFPMAVSECAGGHVVRVEIVDDPIACSYDAAGVLIGGRECSKPIHGCNCFYAGEMIPNNCGPERTVACEPDADADAGA